MKAGWEVKQLGEVCEIYQPQTISKKDMLADGKYPVFGANGIIGRYDKFNHEEPQLLITCRGATCGSVNISEPFSWITGNAMVLRPISDGIDDKYLAYFFRGAVDLDGVITGAAQPQITRKSLAPVLFSFPPLDEQKRIVAVLDAAFDGLARARANVEANLQNARELFGSGLLKTFSEIKNGDKLSLLKEVSIEFGRGKSKHRPRNDKILYGGAYPFIQTGDVRNSKHLIETYSQTYNEVGLKQSKLWPAGTVCITIAANIAETGILAFDSCFPDSIIGMQPDKLKAKSKYVEYLLQYFQKRLKARGEGSAQENLNLRTFETEYFPFPSLEKQHRMIENLDQLWLAVDELEANYKSKLADLDELRQSLLQKAFAGELT